MTVGPVQQLRKLGVGQKKPVGKLELWKGRSDSSIPPWPQAHFQLAGTLRHYVTMSGNNSKCLWSLWGNIAEVILGVEGQSIWLAPGTADNAGAPFPQTLLNNSHFALTAFNPPGVERSLAENTAMNCKMWEKLRSLKDPSPLYVFRSFGFSLVENWREDGFVVGFDGSRLEDARAQIIAVAKDFQQGAVFEYAQSEAGDQFLTRMTVPALAKESAEKVSMVRIVAPAPGNAMLERAWAGPEDVGVL